MNEIAEEDDRAEDNGSENLVEPVLMDPLVEHHRKVRKLTPEELAVHRVFVKSRTYVVEQFCFIPVHQVVLGESDVLRMKLVCHDLEAMPKIPAGIPCLRRRRTFESQGLHRRFQF